MPSDNQKPCDWGRVSEITRRYHDEEWGMPVRDDRRQFEYLMMEVMQCGLSWDLMATEVVRKRRFRGSGVVDFSRRTGKDART